MFSRFGSISAVFAGLALSLSGCNCSDTPTGVPDSGTNPIGDAGVPACLNPGLTRAF